MSSRFARNVEAGIRSGAVDPRIHSGIRAAIRTCDHLIGAGDEQYAYTYLRVDQQTGNIYAKSTGELAGTLNGLTATVASTGETVTGTSRRALLTALAVAHNTHITAARQS